ncbi:MAG: hypothetical protein TREMPRED_003774 [Tremellales sp. Tagirdzhanova-0007]|nr:MAG: hypothetical protein TREMPRED_003774 [Tremellales sp. Tagirdzhanova-0007]
MLGIGRACSIALSQAFSPLVLILSGRREAELHATAKECRDGTVTEICVGDVSDQDDVEKMFGVIKQKYGRLDVVFNVSAVDDDNAGVDLLNSVPLEEADMTKFRQVLDVNIMAAVYCTKEAIKIMKDQSPSGGRIINNGSISATSPRPTPYTISKHAIHGLTRSTSLDGRKYNITATQIDIGNAQTAMGSHAGKGSPQADGTLRKEPMMHVRNVARTLIFLCELDPEADVLEMNVLARGMPFVGRG